MAKKTQLTKLDLIKNRRTWASPQVENMIGEVNNMESQTIPGQSYEISTLVEKYKRGEKLNIPNKIPVFADNPDFDNIDPTTRPDFTLSDYTILQNELNEKKQARKLAKQLAMEEESQTLGEHTTIEESEANERRSSAAETLGEQKTTTSEKQDRQKDEKSVTNT